ncbi:ornithine carbamoyltransferase [Clostridium sp. 19966]|uniref:ornithine carbamoyltransferase n=1 Tax=Clostridium sp. 19966 TaxID=2768166 RepID=UPI0028DD553B|nr:ornithine carbamoyltransferase [Clostridium sp. 19966]MDT8716267.1 ornithine carbamoyltransferase [Clostridium sp. 19966]
MPVNLHGKSFISLLDFSSEEIRYLLDLGHSLKNKKRSGIREKLLEGKNIVLLFEKTSTRTRCSFEIAAYDEGANVTYLNNSQMGKKESVEDTAKVLGRFYDGIEFRGYDHEIVETLAKYSGVPVWNGLTDDDHPTQVLADFMTMEEHLKKPLNRVKLVFIGDGRNNMSNALMYGCAKMGMTYVIYAPEELWPQDEILKKAKEESDKNGGKIIVSSNIEDIKGADAIYTDIWASMGEEDKIEERVALLKSYKVTMDMLKYTENPEIIFMHCLPSYHDFSTEMAKKCLEEKNIDIREVSDEVFRSRHSVVFDEAENRLHSIKAIVVATL